MDKVYLVSSGEYSDYGIIGCFSSRENAMTFIDKLKKISKKRLEKRKEEGYTEENEARIEEHSLDEFIPEFRKGFNPYQVSMKKNGDCSVEPSDGLPVIGRIFYSIPFPDIMEAYVMAADEKHAAKIANEYRTRIIALDKWGEDFEDLPKELEDLV